ncbi:MAG: hypothetical protein JSR93_06325, partial [Verrucomicrobia bacterium]|nr:hypothetical protein [Verrucomicrobiota bacterium]
MRINFSKFIASTTGTLTFMISFLNADPAASPAALNERVSAISQQTVEK